LYLKQSDRKAAIAELRRSLKVSFETSSDEEGYANKRYADIVYLAQLLTQDRDFEGAAELYEFQLRFHPASASLHYGYGNVLFRMRRLAEASREYRAVLEEQPELSLVHRNLGICLATEKDTDGAIAEYRQAQETEPDDRTIRILLGDALLQKGELNGAMEQYQEAIARNPGEAAARVHLAHAFFLNNDAASAVDELERALQLKPDFPEAENELGRIYAISTDPHFRNPETALSAARRAVQSSSEPVPEFLDTLAEALLLNGQPVEALKVEEQAAQLAGANDEIQNRLERFRQAAISASANTP
jgi:tetratricopeptide (TPR) repeat protein